MHTKDKKRVLITGRDSAGEIMHLLEIRRTSSVGFRAHKKMHINSARNFCASVSCSKL